MLTVVLDRRQEATLKVKVPAPGLETGSHPKEARRHGQPAPIVAAPPAPRCPISPHGRAGGKTAPRSGSDPRHTTTCSPAPNSQGSATAAAIRLRRSVYAAGQPAHPQVSGCMGLSVSDRDFPALTGRSGTQRARRQWSAATASTLAPWCSSSSGELRITRVFSCVAHRFKARPSFMFAGCCWWRSLVIDGSSGTRVRSAMARARRLRPCTTAMVSPAR
jgi:hypothetical protein